MVIKITVGDAKGIYETLSSIIDSKLSFNVWSRLFDIMSELEKKLNEVGKKEQALRERIKREWTVTENGTEKIADENGYHQAIIEGVNRLLRSELEVKIQETVTFEDFRSLEDEAITGRDYLNLKTFCRILEEHQKEQETNSDVEESTEN